MQIGLTVGIVFILGLLALQIHSWRAGNIPISRRQKIARLVSALVMILIMAMFMVDDSWIVPRYGLMAKMELWPIACALGIIPMVLAFFDIRESAKQYRSLHRDLIRDVLDPRNQNDEE